MTRRLLAACFLAPAVPAVPAWARLGGNASFDAIPWLRLVLGLVVCIGLALAAALVLRSRSGATVAAARVRKAPRRLQLLETMRVGPQASLSLVKVDGAEYLLVSTSGAAYLTEYQPSGRPGEEASA
jgi:flagellar biogenesis protein FliO